MIKTLNLVGEEEGIFLDSILDSLSEHIAILDGQGVIVKVNKSWRDFADSEGLKWDDYCLGRNYIQVSREAEGLYSEEGSKVADGLERLLEGDINEYSIEYPCHSDKSKRWFLMDANRFVYKDSTYIVVSHKNITERRVSEDEKIFLLTLLRHDLKNKTQIVRGYLQLLLDTDLSDENKDMIEKTLKASIEGQELLDKVGKLKDIGRQRDRGEENIKTHVMKVIDKVGGRLDENGFTLETENLDRTVKAGPLLEELFTNLIMNSMEHSSGSTVWVSTEEEEDKIKTIIEDDGTGIPEETKSKLFEKGFRGGNSSGLGIGLYLVKKIVEKYDGDIDVKDSDHGGARFEITLEKA
ncbi:MAG: ATP-binding protein [Thermoplasmatota archaeon]